MNIKIRKIFLIFLAAAIMLLACSCAAKPSEPVRSAAVGGGSDAMTALTALGGSIELGAETDGELLKQIAMYSSPEAYTPEKSELSLTVEGKKCTVRYSHSDIYRPASPIITDEYNGETADGRGISVTFARGDTSKVIGYMIDLDEYMQSPSDDEDGDILSDMKKLSEEELVELSRKAAGKYTDIGYYKDYDFKYRENADPNACGWYVITFYAAVDGIRAVDHAEVWVYPDGQVWRVISQPTTGIAKSVSNKLNAAACDAYAEEQLAQMYEKAVASFEYSSHKLLRRELSLDDDGNPVIIYWYKVKLNTDKGGSLFNTVTDYATVGVWLG